MGDVALSGVIKSSYRYCLREESQLPRCMDGSSACADPAQQYYWYSTLSDWESDRWLSAPSKINTDTVGVHTYFVSQMGQCGILYPRQISVEVVDIPAVSLKDEAKAMEILLRPERPTISSPNGRQGDLVAACSNIPVVLVGSSAGAKSYQWYMESGQGQYEAIAGKTGSRDTVVGAGRYAVQARLRHGSGEECPSVQLSLPVRVALYPAPSAAEISDERATLRSFEGCDGDTVPLIASCLPNGATIKAYQWYKGDGKQLDEVRGEIGDTYRAGEAGQYAVSYTDGDGCRSALSNALTITEHPMPKQPEIIPSQANLYAGLDYNLLVKYPEASEQYG
jgi:hypothetical protein